MAKIIPFPNTKPTQKSGNMVIEIFDGTAADVGRPDYGQHQLLVAVNESGLNANEFEGEYDNTIWWNGTSYEEAWVAARELAEDFEAPIIDLVSA
jgi:hypothetical protein